MLVTIVSTLLCFWLAYIPYSVAFGKIGSGWETWPDYTRALVAKQTALILLPEIAAVGMGWSRFVGGKGALFGYVFIFAAPILGAFGLFLVMRFV